MRFKTHPLFWFLVAGLATWRITNIIQREEIASPIRKQLGVFEPDGEDPDHWIYPDDFIGKLLHCMYCGSVWVGAAVTLVCFLFPPLILPFAISAVAIFVHDYLNQAPDLYVENMYMETADENDDGDGEA